LTLPIRLRRVAQAEFDQAADWYNAQKPGLGLRYVAAIRQALFDISDQPNRWPEVWPGVREAPVPKWPYYIYYQVHNDYVSVLAVFHASRDPSDWQSRG
jgi:toxin ParE1/3/4